MENSNKGYEQHYAGSLKEIIKWEEQPGELEIEGLIFRVENHSLVVHEVTWTAFVMDLKRRKNVSYIKLKIKFWLWLRLFTLSKVQCEIIRIIFQNLNFCQKCRDDVITFSDFFKSTCNLRFKKRKVHVQLQKKGDCKLFFGLQWATVRILQYITLLSLYEALL